jgi:hypothetical protein
MLQCAYHERRNEHDKMGSPQGLHNRLFSELFLSVLRFLSVASKGMPLQSMLIESSQRVQEHIPPVRPFCCGGLMFGPHLADRLFGVVVRCLAG